MIYLVGFIQTNRVNSSLDGRSLLPITQRNDGAVLLQSIEEYTPVQTLSRLKAAIPKVKLPRGVGVNAKPPWEVGAIHRGPQGTGTSSSFGFERSFCLGKTVRLTRIGRAKDSCCQNAGGGEARKASSLTQRVTGSEEKDLGHQNNSVRNAFRVRHSVTQTVFHPGTGKCPS